jgi:hypothetical protein
MRWWRLVAPARFDRAQRDVDLGYRHADIGKGQKIRMKLSDADVMKDIPVQMHLDEKDASIPMTVVDAVRAAQPKVDVG